MLFLPKELRRTLHLIIMSLPFVRFYSLRYNTAIYYLSPVCIMRMSFDNQLSSVQLNTYGKLMKR